MKKRSKQTNSNWSRIMNLDKFHVNRLFTFRSADNVNYSQETKGNRRKRKNATLIQNRWQNEANLELNYAKVECEWESASSGQNGRGNKKSQRINNTFNIIFISMNQCHCGRCVVCSQFRAHERDERPRSSIGMLVEMHGFLHLMHFMAMDQLTLIVWLFHSFTLVNCSGCI